ncbi:hypothetical protein BC940DRAFT_301023 [Gongronella butleri]|nr:hypothetical protein BC940DRAFT_301023 [Gongronella butleri]
MADLARQAILLFFFLISSIVVREWGLPSLLICHLEERFVGPHRPGRRREGFQVSHTLSRRNQPILAHYCDLAQRVPKEEKKGKSGQRQSRSCATHPISRTPCDATMTTFIRRVSLCTACLKTKLGIFMANGSLNCTVSRVHR